MDSESSSTSSYETKLAVAAIVARRRLISASIFLASTIYTTIPKKNRQLSTRKDWVEYVAKEGSRVFKRMYRMDLVNFNQLLDRIHRQITTFDCEMAVSSSVSPVCAEIRLSMTLRYLGVAQYGILDQTLEYLQANFTDPFGE